MKKPKFEVFYNSTVKGATASEHEGVLYQGFAFKVPHDKFTAPERNEIEAEMLDKVEKLVSEGSNDGGEFVPKGIVERHEVFEAETGDVWIMYRVPFREAQARSMVASLLDDIEREHPEANVMRLPQGTLSRLAEQGLTPDEFTEAVKAAANGMADETDKPAS